MPASSPVRGKKRKREPKRKPPQFWDWHHLGKSIRVEMTSVGPLVTKKPPRWKVSARGRGWAAEWLRTILTRLSWDECYALLWE